MIRMFGPSRTRPLTVLKYFNHIPSFESVVCRHSTAIDTDIYPSGNSITYLTTLAEGDSLSKYVFAYATLIRANPTRADNRSLCHSVDRMLHELPSTQRLETSPVILIYDFKSADVSDMRPFLILMMGLVAAVPFMLVPSAVVFDLSLSPGPLRWARVVKRRAGRRRLRMYRLV